MDYQMFKEQLAALLKRKAGDDFEVKVESVQKLNGIEKEAFVISRKKDWIAPTIYVELLYECCLQGVPLSQIAEKVLESGSGGEKTGESCLFYQLEKCCAADLLRAHSCGENPYAALRSSAQKISRSRGRVLLPDAGKPRAGCDNSDPRDAPGAVGNFGGGAGCPCLGEHPAGSAGAHRQPYGVFERGVRSNVSPVRAWSAGGTVLPGQQPQRKAGCNLHVLSRRAGESFAAL